MRWLARIGAALSLAFAGLATALACQAIWPARTFLPPADGLVESAWNSRGYDAAEPLPPSIPGEILGQRIDRDGWRMFLRDCRIGWRDQELREVLPAKWEDALSYDDYGTAAVRQENKWGWIDRRGNQVLPCDWDQCFTFDAGGLAAVRRNGKWGWIDRTGRTAIPIEYEIVDGFDAHGLAAALRNGKWGWLDRKGRAAIPFEWDQRDDLGKVSGSSGQFVLGRSDLESLTNPTPKFDARGLALVHRNRKWGWIDRSGKIVLPLEWDLAGAFDKNDIAAVRRNGRWGWIDRQGKLAIALEWENSVSESDLFFNTPHFQWHDVAPVQRGGKWGWIDRKGTVLAAPKFDAELWFFKLDRAIVSRGGKWGVVDRAGKEIVPYRWDNMQYSWHESRVAVMENGRWGEIDWQGNVVSPPQDSSPRMYWRDPNQAIAALHPYDENNLWGYRDRANVVRLTPRWPLAREFDEHGFATVAELHTDGVWQPYDFGLIDQNGVYSIPPKWSDIQPCAGGYEAYVQYHPLATRAAIAPPVLWLMTTMKVWDWPVFKDGLKVQYDRRFKQVWRSDLYALRGFHWPAATTCGAVAALFCWAWRWCRRHAKAAVHAS